LRGTELNNFSKEFYHKGRQRIEKIVEEKEVKIEKNNSMFVQLWNILKRGKMMVLEKNGRISVVSVSKSEQEYDLE
jgi:hypothetical protein